MIGKIDNREKYKKIAEMLPEIHLMAQKLHHHNLCQSLKDLRNSADKNIYDIYVVEGWYALIPLCFKQEIS